MLEKRLRLAARKCEMISFLVDVQLYRMLSQRRVSKQDRCRATTNRDHEISSFLTLTHYPPRNLALGSFILALAPLENNLIEMSHRRAKSNDLCN
jgi:hypothetical protein